MKRMITQNLIDYIEKFKSKVGFNDDDAVSLADIEITGDISVKASKIINLETENALFPLEDNAGKVLIVNNDEDGVEASDELELASIDASGKIEGGEILEKMSGYSFIKNDEIPEEFVFDWLYVGVVKTGNKITFIQFCSIKRTAEHTGNDFVSLGRLTIPQAVGSKLYPHTISGLQAVANLNVQLFGSAQSTQNVRAVLIQKNSDTQLQTYLYGVNNLTLNQEYVFRVEATFLLSENLTPSQSE